MGKERPKESWRKRVKKRLQLELRKFGKVQGAGGGPQAEGTW